MLIPHRRTQKRYDQAKFHLYKDIDRTSGLAFKIRCRISLNLDYPNNGKYFILYLMIFLMTN